MKKGEILHEDIGQMNFYLNYFRQEVCTEGDNDPIGIVLGANMDNLTREYAIDNISNQLFICRYQLYLPNREGLERELGKVLEEQLSSI